MNIFNYEVIIKKVNTDEELKRVILDKAEQNAKAGLIQAQLELRTHTLMLEGAEDNNRTEAEIKGYTDAIERDEKSINNWETQLTAIKYER
jgi:hypothetical protein